MNAAMVRDATDSLSSTDVVLFVVDAAARRGAEEDFILGEIARAGTPAVLALNKIDLLRKERLLPIIAAFSERHAFRDIVPVSAKTGENLDRLVAVLGSHLPEGVAAYPEDFLTSTPETEWMAEVIREKLLERTRDELPFAHAVVVESVRDREPDGVTVVTASIVVEREGQKGIVVGKGGSMIRDIGTAVEAFEADRGKYPGPTDGLVPIEQIRAQLVPGYAASIPLQDAWGFDMLYRSDGKDYVILSPGKDGKLDMPYGREIEEAATQKFEDDLVFADGRFIRAPGESQK